MGDVLGLDGLGLRARVFPLRRGTWDSASEPVLRGRRRPLLLVDGVVLHIVTVRGREGAELLGPGDLIPVDDDTETFTARDRVLVPGGFTVIDERVLVSAAAQPQLLGAFGEAAIRQAGQLAGQVVLAQQVAIDDRLRILLPSLAERWGRVTSDGVVLPSFLSHTVLSALVGARRPSLTAAVGRLVEDGTVRRLPDRRWLLCGGLDGIG